MKSEKYITHYTESGRRSMRGSLDMTTVKELHVWFNDDSYLLVTGKEAEDATIDLLKYAMRGTPLFVSLAENKYYASTSISTFKVVEEEQ